MRVCYRMEVVCNANIQSVRNCEVDKLGKLDLRPHIITRRYAEFSAAIGGLNESFPDQRIENILDALSAEVSTFYSVFPNVSHVFRFFRWNFHYALYFWFGKRHWQYF